MIRPFKVSSAYAALDSNRLGCHIRKIIILLAYDVFVFGRAFSGLRERTRRRISRSCLKNGAVALSPNKSKTGRP